MGWAHLAESWAGGPRDELWADHAAWPDGGGEMFAEADGSLEWVFEDGSSYYDAQAHAHGDWEDWDGQ